MNKILLSFSVALLSSCCLINKAQACERNISVGDWRGFSNIYPLPTSEVVCVDSGFDRPIVRVVLDDNFLLNGFGEKQKGILTSWFENGVLKASKYNKSTTEQGMVPISDPELDLKVDNHEFISYLNPKDNSYQLSSEAVRALANAYASKAKVQIRFPKLGIVNFIGEDTVISLGELYLNSPQQYYRQELGQQKMIDRFLIYGH
jgi:hypothetical protein